MSMPNRLHTVILLFICGRASITRVCKMNSPNEIVLIEVLSKKLDLSEMHEFMLRQGHRLRKSRKNYVLLNAKLEKLWLDHNNETLHEN